MRKKISRKYIQCKKFRIGSCNIYRQLANLTTRVKFLRDFYSGYNRTKMQSIEFRMRILWSVCNVSVDILTFFTPRLLTLAVVYVVVDATAFLITASVDTSVFVTVVAITRRRIILRLLLRPLRLLLSYDVAPEIAQGFAHLLQRVGRCHPRH